MAYSWDYQWLTLAVVQCVGVQQCTITTQPSVTSIAASAASCTQLSARPPLDTRRYVRLSMCTSMTNELKGLKYAFVLRRFKPI